MKAIWNNQILAESDHIIVIEGNHYFPPDSINKKYFVHNNTESTCPWKGVASYYTLDVDGQINTDAAWYYKNPKERAIEIKNYIAFWKGVKIEE